MATRPRCLGGGRGNIGVGDGGRGPPGQWWQWGKGWPSRHSSTLALLLCHCH
jgi:hypothetical protein